MWTCESISPGAHRTVGIDDDIAPAEAVAGNLPDRLDQAVVHQDRIARRGRRLEIPRQDPAEIDNRRPHPAASQIVPPAQSRAIASSCVMPPTRALSRPPLARQKMIAISSGIGASGSVSDIPS